MVRGPVWMHAPGRGREATPAPSRLLDWRHERSERTCPGGRARSGGVPTMHRRGVLGARLGAVGGSRCATTMDWARTIWETSVRARHAGLLHGKEVDSGEGANRVRGSRRAGCDTMEEPCAAFHPARPCSSTVRGALPGVPTNTRRPCQPPRTLVQHRRPRPP